MKRCKLIIPLLTIISLFLFMTGCEEDASTAPEEPTSIQGWISQGWSEYRAGDINYSLESFEEAIDWAESNYWEAFGDSIYAAQTGDSVLLQQAIERMATANGQLTESLTGLGWGLIEYHMISDGAFVFSTALELDPTYVDAYGGYAVLLQTGEQWLQSNEQIDGLMALDPDWNFQYNNIDYLDLLLMKAENFFFLGDFASSLQEAVALTQIAAVGYPGEVSEEDFNLATIEGRAALISLIDELDDLI